MAPKICIQYSLVEISDKAEAPALLSSIVLRDVDIANPPVLVKQTLEIISGGPEKVWSLLENVGRRDITFYLCDRPSTLRDTILLVSGGGPPPLLYPSSRDILLSFLLRVFWNRSSFGVLQPDPLAQTQYSISPSTLDAKRRWDRLPSTAVGTK